MTVHSGAPAPATLDRTPRRPPQWRAIARLHVSDALRHLLIASAVLLVLLVVGGVLARWQGWELAPHSDALPWSTRVETTRDGVEIAGALFALVPATGVAAAVIAIVLASRTRVLVATGATRRSIAIAQLVSVGMMSGWVLLVAGALLLVMGAGTTGAMALLGADTAADVAAQAARGAGTVLTVLLAGSAVTAVFLRWPWWVGVGSLAVLLGVLPAVARLAWPALVEALDAAARWWGADLVTAAVAAGVYWLVVRRIPVP